MEKSKTLKKNKSALSRKEIQDARLRLKQIRGASLELKKTSLGQRNSILKSLIEKLSLHEKAILSANKNDLDRVSSSSQNVAAFLERLTLSEKRLYQMKESLHSVIQAKDPLNERVDSKTLKNGLFLERIRSPIGVCFMIFESRPNVITEAFSLALKSGNALILKGGKESDETSQALYRCIEESLPQPLNHGFWGMVGASRALTDHLMLQNDFIDVLIPRGGDRLIEYVTKNSTLPLIKNDRGLCHVYVHHAADLDMALKIVDNAKTQRPGVCNAMETLLVDNDIAPTFLPMVFETLSKKGVVFQACPVSYSLARAFDQVVKATEKSFDTEHLALIMNVKVVAGLPEALLHIEEHGSHHSEAIITENESVAKEFQMNVDAAAVYWNASTRFTDGFEFGLGGEMGISTQKIHVRGPVGLEALTTPRWVIKGQGQIRE